MPRLVELNDLSDPNQVAALNRMLRELDEKSQKGLVPIHTSRPNDRSPGQDGRKLSAEPSLRFVPKTGVGEDGEYTLQAHTGKEWEDAT